MKLAKEIEVQEVLAVGNKVRNEEERQFIETKMAALDVPVAAYIPYDDSVAMADMLGKAPIDHDPDSKALKALSELIGYLNKRYDF